MSNILPPFQRVLGEALSQVPAPVRDLHSRENPLQMAGRAEITTADNPAARLLCWLAGLPEPGADVPVTVGFDPDGEGAEFWQRRFRGRNYASVMMAGSRRDAGLLVERFPPFTYYHRLTASPEGVAWRLVKWRFLGVPLPRFTVPDIRCLESAEGDRYCFDIAVIFPLVGPVIHYRGWLVPRQD